jgi:hypothetical protein
LVLRQLRDLYNRRVEGEILGNLRDTWKGLLVSPDGVRSLLAERGDVEYAASPL